MFRNRKLKRLYRSLAFELSSVPITNALSTFGFAFRAFEAGGPISIWANQPVIENRSEAYNIGISQWELETILREVLIHSPLYGTSRISDWNKFANVSNKLKAICNEAWPDDRDENLVFFELFRIPHRQFSWQRNLSSAYLNRYLYLYSQPPLEALIKAKLNMSGAECILAAFAIHVYFQQHLNTDSHFGLESVGIDEVRAKALLDRISISRKDAVTHCLQQIPTADLNFEYLPSIFVERPLMSLTTTDGDKIFYCPVPRHLMCRLVDGLYFDIVGARGFENAYGGAFQNYVSALAQNSLPSMYSVLDEQPYGPTRQRKDSIDLIIEDHSATIFVECKTRRVKRISKVDLSDEDITHRQLDDLVSMLVQSYVTIDDAMRNQYPHWKKKARPSYLLIVLLTPWHVLGAVLWGYIIKKVHSKLDAIGISAEILTEVPVTICSCEEFEQLCAVLNGTSIDILFGLKTDDYYAQWALDTFLREQYAELMKEHIRKVGTGHTTIGELLEPFIQFPERNG